MTKTKSSCVKQNKQTHWVLLRGLGRDKRHWGRFVEKLQSAFPEDTVQCIDTLGNGDFCQHKSPVVISEYTRHVRSQVSKHVHKKEESKEESKEQKNHVIRVIGLSLGGMIALDWANTAPEEIDQLVVINTSVANHSAPTMRFKPQALCKLTQQVCIKSTEASILSITSNYPKIRQQTTAYWQQLRKEKKTSLPNLVRQIAAASKFSLESVINVRTILIASDQDQIVDAQCSRDMRSYFLTNRLDFYSHPTAGHDIPLDEPEWLLDILAKSV